MMKKISPNPFCLFLPIFLILPAQRIFAQPLQREWVRNYSLAQTKTNQATGIVVAADGNIVVAGSSENANGDLDYYIIKYKPNGDQVWAVRYDSQNSGNDQLRGIAADPNGNVIVTGTTDTVKFNSAGAFVWSQPLGGRALIANADYVYVTGFSEVDIATAQLQNNNSDGQELWRRTIDGPVHGNDIGQAITLGGDGNVYVAGQEDGGCVGAVCHRRFASASYSPNGVQRWFNDDVGALPAISVQVNSILANADESAFIYGSYYGFNTVFLLKANANGNTDWYSHDFATVGTKAVIDKLSQNIALTGRRGYNAETGVDAAFLIMLAGTKPTSLPQPIWLYKSTYGRTEGSDIKQDSAGNLFVAGYSDNDASSTAMFLAKLSTSGQQLGLDRYNSPNAGSNFATAMAIDSNDNVYVTGYVMNTQDGSEFVTIKYSASPKIEKKPRGAMHIEFHTNPGQQYAIEGTSDFFNWQSLITNTADLNGVVQYDDTNAPNIPLRFYRGNSAP